MSARLGMAAIVMLAMLPAYAALYRWIDERGVVQFSDQPPPRHADGASISLDVPQPASGTAPLTTSIMQRSKALSESGGGKVVRKRNRPSTARRSTATRSSSSSRRNSRRPSPTFRVPGY